MFNQEQQQELPNLTVKPELQFVENDEMYRIISFEEESKLDNKLKEFNDFIEDENNVGERTTQENDEIYKQAQTYINEFKLSLRDARFNFHLNRPQYNLLIDLLKRKLEYDVNTLFVALELEQMLENMYGSKFQNDTQVIEYTVTATEITYIYHLLSQHKVKGINEKAKVFASILMRIGEVSKLVSYYDGTAKGLTDELAKWAHKLIDTDAGVEGVVTQPTPITGPQL